MEGIPVPPPGRRKRRPRRPPQREQILYFRGNVQQFPGPSQGGALFSSGIEHEDAKQLSDTGRIRKSNEIAIKSRFFFKSTSR